MCKIIDFNNSACPKAIENDNISNTNRFENRISETCLDEILKSLDEKFDKQIFLSIQEVSNLFSICYESIRKKVANNEIKAFSFGKKKVIPIAEIRRIIINGGI